jgi:hypothetical protein
MAGYIAAKEDLIAKQQVDELERLFNLGGEEGIAQ